MSIAAAALVWAIVVIASILLVAYFATRWGRDPFGWALLAAVMGPIAPVGLVGAHQSDRVRRALPFERIGAPAGARPPVIVACDGSPASATAARYLAATAAPGTDIVLCTVLPREARPGDAWAGAAAEHARSVTAATGEAVRILAVAGHPVRVVVGYGDPAEELLRYAEEEHAAAIVLGRRGAGLTKALLGSVSERVARHAKIPVVIVE
ncbi:MAG TPA: universal stress protein [Dehalococcoidia bacterium]|nr:universal stress protein [Dehalococcoidia bacterium]